MYSKYCAFVSGLVDAFALEGGFDDKESTRKTLDFDRFSNGGSIVEPGRVSKFSSFCKDRIYQFIKHIYRVFYYLPSGFGISLPYPASFPLFCQY